MDYTQPLSAAMQRTPMNDSSAVGWQQQGPLNFDFGMGPEMGLAMKFAGPLFLNGLMAQANMTPAQFIPTQGFADQMTARRQMEQQQKAVSIAAAEDKRHIEKTILGGMQLVTGRAATDEDKQQAFKMSQTASEIMPYLTMALGEDVVDQLHGSRGSATVMASAMHRGMQLGYDPVTGTMGASGESSGLMTRYLHRNMYGDDKSLGAMRGVSAGQAGMLYDEMSQRGLIQQAPLGRESASVKAQAAAAIKLTDADIADLAERTERITKIRQSGKEVTEKDYESARDDVRSTQNSLRSQVAAGATISTADLDKPIAQDLVRVADAGRINGRLKNMSGAVAAMREIFGDMGHSGTMKEILNGLEALSQNSIGSMSPAKLEEMVRTTQVIAKTTGVSVQGILGLTAQNADLGRQLGLDEGLAVGNTQSAVLYGNAGRASGRLGGFGGLTPEKATLLSGQLQTTAAASQTANQMNAAIRLQKEGHLTAGSDAELMAQAVMRGDKTYRAKDGTDKSVFLDDNDWADLMKDGGVNSAVAEQVLSDRYGNQEMGRDYNTADLTRRGQFDVDLAPRLGTSFGGALMGSMVAAGAEDKLKAAGVLSDEESLIEFTRETGDLIPGMMKDFTAEEMKAGPAQNKAMAVRVERATEEAAKNRVRAKGKQAGESDTDFETRVNKAGAAALATLGPVDPDTGLRAQSAGMGLGLVADANATIRNDRSLSAYGTLSVMLQAQDEKVFTDVGKQRAEVRSKVALQSALAGLGSAGPLARISDILRDAKPGEDIGKLALKALGGIDLKEIADRTPIKTMNDTVASYADLERDATGVLTEKGEAEAAMNATVIKGLVNGGTDAVDSLKAFTRHVMGADGKEEDLDKFIQSKLDSKSLSADDRKKYTRYLETAHGLRESRSETSGVRAIFDDAQAARKAAGLTPLGETPTEATAREAAQLAALTDKFGWLSTSDGADPKAFEEADASAMLKQYVLQGEASGYTGKQLAELSKELTPSQKKAVAVKLAEVHASAEYNIKHPTTGADLVKSPETEARIKELLGGLTVDAAAAAPAKDDLSDLGKKLPWLPTKGGTDPKAFDKGDATAMLDSYVRNGKGSFRNGKWSGYTPEQMQELGLALSPEQKKETLAELNAAKNGVMYKVVASDEQKARMESLITGLSAEEKKAESSPAAPAKGDVSFMEQLLGNGKDFVQRSIQSVATNVATQADKASRSLTLSGRLSLEDPHSVMLTATADPDIEIGATA